MKSSTLVLVLLALGGRQETASDLESLLNRLEEGSHPARAATEAELIRLGPAIEPALRKRMAVCPREAWSSFDRVLGRIETNERRRRFRAAASGVSLKVEGRPFAEIVPELERVVGVPLGRHPTLNQAVTVDLKDVSPLEALDGVCASANIAWHAQWRLGSPDILPQLIFRGSPGAPAPGAFRYVKGFRLGLPSMGIQRRRTPFSDEASAWVAGILQPPPALGHIQLDEVVIDRIVDDRGDVLHEGATIKGARPPRPQRLAGAASDLGHLLWTVTVKPPGPEIKSFSILGGRAEIRGEVERKHVALETSESVPGRTLEFEGLTLTLDRVQRGKGKVVIGVIQKGRRIPGAVSETELVVEGPQLEFAVLRLRDGSTVYPERVNRLPGGKGLAEHVFATEGEPIEIRFITYTVWERETLNFEYRDLPLADPPR